MLGAIEPILQLIDLLQELKAVGLSMPDSGGGSPKFNAIQQQAKALLSALPDLKAPPASAGSSSAPATTMGMDMVDPASALPGVKSATATKDTAAAQLQDLQDAAAQRKADFEMKNVNLETNVL